MTVADRVSRAERATDHAEIVELFQNGTGGVRATLSKNPYTPADVLEAIAVEAHRRLETGEGGLDWDVEEALLVNVAAHDNSPYSILPLAAMYSKAQRHVLWRGVPADVLHLIVTEYVHDRTNDWYAEQFIASHVGPEPKTLSAIFDWVHNAFPTDSALARVTHFQYEPEEGPNGPEVARSPWHVLGSLTLNHDTPQSIREHSEQRMVNAAELLSREQRENLQWDLQTIRLEHGNPRPDADQWVDDWVERLSA